MHTTVKVVATAALSVAIAVTLKCTSLSQHCYFHCCPTAGLVFAVTALCTSVSDRCGNPPVYYYDYDYDYYFLLILLLIALLTGTPRQKA